MTSSLRKICCILGVLPKRVRLRYLLSLFIQSLASLLDVFSIALIIPFLEILTSPGKFIEQFGILSDLGIFSEGNIYKVQLAITLAFIIATIIAGAVKVYALKLNSRAIKEIAVSISVIAYSNLLFQNYLYFKKAQSSSLLSLISTQVPLCIGCINYFNMLIINTFFSIAIIASLLIVDPSFAIAAIAIFSLFYLGTAYFLRPRLKELSFDISSYNREIISIVSETFLSIKSILLYDQADIYYHEFSRFIIRLKNAEARSQFLSIFPKYIAEGIGLILLSCISFAFAISSEGRSFVPLVGFLAISSQKLVPSLQQCYSGYSVLKAYTSTIDLVFSSLRFSSNKRTQHKVNCPDKATLDPDCIVIQDLSFQYEDKKLILDNMSCKIPLHGLTGIVGKSGSGKTTFVDILMGLLKPTSGSVLILDSNQNLYKLEEILSEWQKCISYLPQRVYIYNRNLAFNITCSEQLSNEEKLLLQESIELAELSDFASECELKELGENGSKLSGGQAQRIGLARALYRRGRVLVLDEPTSSLDIETSVKLMLTFKRLSEKIPILIICHKKSTIDLCDQVFTIGGR